MGPPESRDVSRTHSLFVDDLKVYQENHDVNEVIVQTSHDTGAHSVISKWAEIVFERGNMVRREGLEVLGEMIDLDKNKIYKFLGKQQVDKIKTKKVFERVKRKVNKRVKMLTNTELNDVTLVRAVNMKAIPVADYPINVCKFTDGELKELDQVIKRELRSKNMLGKQSSNERLYLRREDYGREIKLLKDIYKETRLKVAYYMACSENKWISAAWRRENTKEDNSIVEEAMKTMEDVGVEIQIAEGNIQVDEELIDGGWKPAWKRLKKTLRKGVKNQMIEEYGKKEQQSK